MTIEATAQAINDAKASLMALYDEHLPPWDDAEGRLAFIAAVEETFEHLDSALVAAGTTTAPHVIAESEDGTAPASRNG